MLGGGAMSLAAIHLGACSYDWTYNGSDAGDAQALPCNCSPEEYCVFPDHMCGAGTPGVCTPKPSCSGPAPVVCACVGPGMGSPVAPSQCAAARNGGDVSVTGCPLTAGDMFLCGYEYCSLGLDGGPPVELCVVHPASGTYECVPYTPPCGDCACMIQCPGGMCVQGNGAPQLVCPSS